MPYSVNDNWRETSNAISEYMDGFLSMLPPQVRWEYLAETEPEDIYEHLCLSLQGGTPDFTVEELARWISEGEDRRKIVEWPSSIYKPQDPS